MLLISRLIAYGIAEWRQCPPIYEALRFRNQSPAIIDVTH
jgi:hypothetical protein